MKSLLKILVVSVAMAVTGCGEGVEEGAAAQEQVAAAQDVAGDVGLVEQKLCSPGGAASWAVVNFYSKVSYPLNMYWVNEYCQEIYMGQIPAYGSIGSNTSVRHVFRFRNAWNNNALIYEYPGAPNSGYFYVNVPY